MPSSTPLRGLRMTDDLYLKLRYLAKKDNRSYNQEAVFILKSYVEDYESSHGTIPVDPDELYQ